MRMSVPAEIRVEPYSLELPNERLSCQGNGVCTAPNIQHRLLCFEQFHRDCGHLERRRVGQLNVATCCPAARFDFSDAYLQTRHIFI